MHHQHFEPNTEGRDFIVGDIHGEFARLRRMLDTIGFNHTRDRLFCVGDLVDRGPTSEVAMTWLTYPWFHSVRGNHEDLTIKAHRGDTNDRGLHIMNGGIWFAGLMDDERADIALGLDHLPYVITIGDVGLVHAEVMHKRWEDFLAQLDDPRIQMATIWGRHRITYLDDTEVSGIREIVVGHTPPRPLVPTRIGNHFYIDTGACFPDGYFTIYEPVTRRLHREAPRV